MKSHFEWRPQENFNVTRCAHRVQQCGPASMSRLGALRVAPPCHALVPLDGVLTCRSPLPGEVVRQDTIWTRPPAPPAPRPALQRRIGPVEMEESKVSGFGRPSHTAARMPRRQTIVQCLTPI